MKYCGKQIDRHRSAPNISLYGYSYNYILHTVILSCFNLCPCGPAYLQPSTHRFKSHQQSLSWTTQAYLLWIGSSFVLTIIEFGAGIEGLTHRPMVAREPLELPMSVWAGAMPLFGNGRDMIVPHWVGRSDSPTGPTGSTTEYSEGSLYVETTPQPTIIPARTTKQWTTVNILWIVTI